jgi:hypothetical protein
MKTDFIKTMLVFALAGILMIVPYKICLSVYSYPFDFINWIGMLGVMGMLVWFAVYGIDAHLIKKAVIASLAGFAIPFALLVSVLLILSSGLEKPRAFMYSIRLFYLIPLSGVVSFYISAIFTKKLHPDMETKILVRLITASGWLISVVGIIIFKIIRYWR